MIEEASAGTSETQKEPQGKTITRPLFKITDTSMLLSEAEGEVDTGIEYLLLSTLHVMGECILTLYTPDRAVEIYAEGAVGCGQKEVDYEWLISTRDRILKEQ